MIELIIVLIIVGILSSIAGPMMRVTTDKAKWSEAVNTLGAIRSAVQLYYAEKCYWPFDSVSYIRLNFDATDQQACQNLLRLTLDISTTNKNHFLYFLARKGVFDSNGYMAIACEDKGDVGGTTNNPQIWIDKNGRFLSDANGSGYTPPSF